MSNAHQDWVDACVTDTAPDSSGKRTTGEARRRRPTAWSASEIRTLCHEHSVHGNYWKQIASKLKGRSAAEAKNIFHSTLRSIKPVEPSRRLLFHYARAVGSTDASDRAVRRQAFERAQQLAAVAGRAAYSRVNQLATAGRVAASGDDEHDHAGPSPPRDPPAAAAMSAQAPSAGLGALFAAHAGEPRNPFENVAHHHEEADDGLLQPSAARQGLPPLPHDQSLPLPTPLPPLPTLPLLPLSRRLLPPSNDPLGTTASQCDQQQPAAVPPPQSSSSPPSLSLDTSCCWSPSCCSSLQQQAAVAVAAGAPEKGWPTLITTGLSPAVPTAAAALLPVESAAAAATRSSAHAAGCTAVGGDGGFDGVCYEGFCGGMGGRPTGFFTMGLQSLMQDEELLDCLLG